MCRYLLYAPLGAYWSMTLAVALGLFTNHTLLLLGGVLAASAAVLILAQPADPAQREPFGTRATRPVDSAGG
jgi:hypothetical protein